MKKSFCKRIVAVLLTLCMAISMVTMSATTAFAKENRIIGGLKDAGVDKLIELSVRGLCELTLGLSESMNEDSQEAVESICSWILMDASEAAIAKVQETCDEILQELYVIEDKLTDYTVDISSDLAKQTITKAKENYQSQWTKDVSNVMKSKHDQMGNVYNSYLYYFIMSDLLANGYPEDQNEIDVLNTYLKSVNFSINKEDVTQKNVDEAKQAVTLAFHSLADDKAIDKDAALYTNKEINMLFVNTIKALSDKLERTGYEAQGEPNVLDRAATYAYFALPYNEQQYEFVSGTAQKQAMVIVMLELAYGEFLSQQGEYFADKYGDGSDPDVTNWADENLISYGDNMVSYNSVRNEFFGSENSTESEKSCVLYALEKIAQMFSSPINIDASSYTGDYNDQVLYLGQYFKPEDATSVELTINSFEDEYNYTSNNAIKELVDGLECSGLTTKKNRIQSEKVRFNRIVPGNNSGQVYYILDASYYGELELKSLYNKIKREGPLGGSDRVYGDLHVASMDYMNLMKDMSDGTNTFKCPADLNTSLANLNKTVAFAAAYGYYPCDYLSRYLPINPDAPQTFRLLENDYYLDLNLNFGDGPYMVRDAETDLANLNKSTNTDYKFNMSNVNFSSIADSSDKYTMIVANTSSEYKQKVALEFESDCAQLSLVDGSNTITSTGTVKSGNDITLKVKLEEGNVLKSLRCIRKNVETKETVLIDEGEAEYFYNEDTGCYEFNYNMPYSETQFVLETQKGIPDDGNGTFVVRTYGDLLVMAENVNNGVSEYVNGNYILSNDITVPANEYWNTSIGTPSSKFSGTFDGQGYKIIGLKSNMPAFYEPDSIVNQSNMGLFGYVRDAQFENLCLENVNFSFDEEYNVSYVGAICARAEGDNTFSKCMVSGSMNFKSASDVGGLVGVAIAGKNNIINCANHIDFNINSGYTCGGIAGSCDSGATITNCYTVGSFNGSFRNCTVIKGSGGKVNNCYVLDNTSFVTYSGTTECTLEQFKSGEVTYLLNKTSTLPNYVWFQSIDNGEIPDEFPTLDFARNKVVFKVDREDKAYSNTPKGYLLGDTDLDLNITVMDATVIQMHCAKLYELTDIALVNADVNKDRIISITDATRIQAHVAQIMPIE